MLLIVGIVGASGVIYGIRLLEALSTNREAETHLIISEAGAKSIRYETDWKLEEIQALADFYYGIDDTGATLASGSFKRDGMRNSISFWPFKKYGKVDRDESYCLSPTSCLLPQATDNSGNYRPHRRQSP